eukprot:5220652-Ditylum_brightwellii.AAC.1
MLHASHAPLEHIFDNHYYCGEWCQQRNYLAKLDKVEITNQSGNYWKKEEVLEQSRHTFDMQKMRA